MFGYVTTNLKTLSKEDKEKYRAHYCGLCHALRENYGRLGQMALNYDITFMYIFLSEVYSEKTTLSKTKCFPHPIKEHTFAKNCFAEYCASVNIMLFYLKFLDNWNDDKNIISLTESKLYYKKYQKACKNYPEKANAIKESLEALSRIEKDNILNPDIASQTFGHLMGSVFAVFEDDKKEKLYNFGFALGKFIYIMDACVDLKHDIKHQSYNPMIFTDSGCFEEILKMLMNDCLKALSELGVSDTLVNNILLEGIWTRFYMKFFKEKKDE